MINFNSGNGEVVIGAAVKGCQKSSKPIYVSQGHRVSLETAIEVVVQCSKLSCTSCLRHLCLGGCITCLIRKRESSVSYFW